MTSPVGTEALLDAVDALPIDELDLRASGRVIADALACMAGAQAAPAAQPALRWARRQGATPQACAFVLGALSNVLEMDAMHVASSVHPGTVVVPAAIAAAVSVGASGEALARAVLRGTEAAVRLGRATGPAHRRRFQSTSTCAGFGAALACADLLGLTRAQALDAMGNMASTAGGLWAFIDEDVSTKQWHAGKAAEAAVSCAQLAGEGMRGPRHVLDGPRGFLAVLCDGGDPTALNAPGERWQLHDTAFKPWPSPRPTHAAITAALRIRQAIGADTITHVVLRTYGLAVDLCNRPEVRTSHDARFSLKHCSAVALARGAVDFGSFESDEIARQAELVSRVEVVEEPSMTSAYPRRSPASFEIALADGRTVFEQVDFALGDPEMPMSDEQRLEKRRGLLALASLDVDDALRAELEALPALSGDIASLLQRLFRPAELGFRDG